MKHLSPITSLLLGISLLSCTASTVQNWKQFTSSRYGFSVEVPNEPKETSMEVVTGSGSARIPIHIFTSATATGLAYGVTVTELPSASTTLVGQSQLSNALDGLQNTYSGSIIERKSFTTFGDKPAIDFVLQLSPTRSSRGMMVVSGNRIYQVTVGGDVSDNQNDERFLESFELL